MGCKICGSPTYSLGRAKVLDRYWAEFSRCRNCYFVAAENVHWLSEAYSEAINTSDLGLVGRNIRLSYSLPLLIRSTFNPQGRFIDYGGGYGLLVRVMRDRGFDFYRYDQYCQNLFAKGFDAEVPAGGEAPFEMLVAIEVFEHLENPIPEISEMLKFSKNIFFATEVLPDDREILPGEWSYYGLEHGQHISIFTRKALQILADRFGLFYVTSGRGLHMFTTRKISNFRFRLATTATFGRFGLPLLQRPSLLNDDYKKVTGHDL